MLLLSNNVHDYYFVSQGKTTIPGLDDGEELLITDVSASLWPAKHYLATFKIELSTSRSADIKRRITWDPFESNVKHKVELIE